MNNDFSRPTEMEVEGPYDYLSRNFARARKRFHDMSGQKSVKGTDIYKAEVEFCYRMNEITHGSSYVISKMVGEIKELIDDLNAKAAELSEKK